MLEIPKQGVLNDQFDEIWYVSYNDRRRNLIGTRNEVLMAMCQNTDQRLEAERQRPLLKWLNQNEVFKDAIGFKIGVALDYLLYREFIDQAEFSWLVHILRLKPYVTHPATEPDESAQS